MGDDPDYFGTTTVTETLGPEPTEVPQPEGLKAMKDDEDNLNVGLAPAVILLLTKIMKSTPSCIAGKSEAVITGEDGLQRRAAPACGLRSVATEATKDPEFIDMLAHLFNQVADLYNANLKEGQAVAIFDQAQMVLYGLTAAEMAPTTMAVLGGITGLGFLAGIYDIWTQSTPHELPPVIEFPKNNVRVVDGQKEGSPDDEKEDRFKSCGPQFTRPDDYVSLKSFWEKGLLLGDSLTKSQPGCSWKECNGDQKNMICTSVRCPKEPP